MPTFEYKAKTQGGELVTGTLAAGDRRLAMTQLGRLGYFPLAVEVAKTERSVKREFGFRRGRVTTREALMFTRQLATLLRAGMSLSDALSALIRRTQHPALAAIVTQLRADIIQGESLSGALAKHPKLFNRFYINLTRAGEASGSLEAVLDRLSRHYEQMAELREKVIGALIYPLLVMVVGTGAIIFFMTFMLPRFSQMFKDIGRALPMPTRVLIAISDGFLSFWWIGALLVVAGFLIYRQWVRTPKGRLAFDGWKLRLPLLGNVIMTSAFARFSRTLATLLENGVPVLTALQLVEDTMNNRVIANEIREARTRVTDGTSLSQPLAKGKIFPPLLIDMLAVGEESGAVVPALKTIADTYEGELSYRLRIFTTLLEPAIILFVAMLVGGLVLSVLMAVFDITSGLGH